MNSLRNATPAAKRSRTMADLLSRITDALNADDYGIDPRSIDTQGMTVIDARNGLQFRLELTEDGLQDHDEWERLNNERFSLYVRMQELRPTDDHRHDAFIGGCDDDESYQEPEF